MYYWPFMRDSTVDRWIPSQMGGVSHYIDIIMTTMASQITNLTVVYSTIYSDVDQRKYHSSASLAFVWGIHRRPVNSPHKWPVTRKMFPFDDVIMYMMTWWRVFLQVWSICTNVRWLPRFPSISWWEARLGYSSYSPCCGNRSDHEGKQMQHIWGKKTWKMPMVYIVCIYRWLSAIE